MKKRLTMIAAIVGIASLLLASMALTQTGENLPKEKAFRIERGMPDEAMACI